MKKKIKRHDLTYSVTQEFTSYDTFDITPYTKEHQFGTSIDSSFLYQILKDDGFLINETDDKLNIESEYIWLPDLEYPFINGKFIYLHKFDVYLNLIC